MEANQETPIIQVSDTRTPGQGSSSSSDSESTTASSHNSSNGSGNGKDKLGPLPNMPTQRTNSRNFFQPINPDEIETPIDRADSMSPPPSRTASSEIQRSASALSTASIRSNSSNEDFYDSTAQDNSKSLRSLAEQAGMHTSPDMEALNNEGILPEDKNALIMIACGGYGRELKWLFKKGYQQFTFIERTLGSVAQAEAVVEQYKETKNPNINVDMRTMDILTLKPEETRKHALILLLWAGLSDFIKDDEKDEPFELLQILVSCLAAAGLLVVDVPNNQQTNATSTTGQLHTIESEDHPPYVGYVPTLGEVQAYNTRLNTCMSRVGYSTQTERDRWLYIFWHKDNPKPPDIKPIDETEAEQAADRHGAKAAATM